jgi:hypothetical protein
MPGNRAQDEQVREHIDDGGLIEVERYWNPRPV